MRLRGAQGAGAAPTAVHGLRAAGREQAATRGAPGAERSSGRHMGVGLSSDRLLRGEQ